MDLDEVVDRACEPVYVLRHTAAHLACLRREMHRREIPRPRY